MAASSQCSHRPSTVVLATRQPVSWWTIWRYEPFDWTPLEPGCPLCLSFSVAFPLWFLCNSWLVCCCVCPCVMCVKVYQCVASAMWQGGQARSLISALSACVSYMAHINPAFQIKSMEKWKSFWCCNLSNGRVICIGVCVFDALVFCHTVCMLECWSGCLCIWWVHGNPLMYFDVICVVALCKYWFRSRLVSYVISRSFSFYQANATNWWADSG